MITAGFFLPAPFSPDCRLCSFMSQQEGRFRPGSDPDRTFGSPLSAPCRAAWAGGRQSEGKQLQSSNLSNPGSREKDWGAKGAGLIPTNLVKMIKLMGNKLLKVLDWVQSIYL